MPQTDTPPAKTKASHLSISFLHWYYGVRPQEIVSTYMQYASAFASAFSFMFMLRTLFAPWKSIKDAYPKKGFNLSMILETLTLNVTARVIGFLFRLAAMIAGVVIEIAVFVFFALYLLLWLVFPLLLIGAVPVLFTVILR